VTLCEEASDLEIPRVRTPTVGLEDVTSRELRFLARSEHHTVHHPFAVRDFDGVAGLEHHALWHQVREGVLAFRRVYKDVYSVSLWGCGL
jgi:hypothetical protein